MSEHTAACVVWSSAAAYATPRGHTDETTPTTTGLVRTVGPMEAEDYVHGPDVTTATLLAGLENTDHIDVGMQRPEDMFQHMDAVQGTSGVTPLGYPDRMQLEGAFNSVAHAEGLTVETGPTVSHPDWQRSSLFGQQSRSSSTNLLGFVDPPARNWNNLFASSSPLGGANGSMLVPLGPPIRTKFRK